jgi:hypothetical protein
MNITKKLISWLTNHIASINEVVTSKCQYNLNNQGRFIIFKVCFENPLSKTNR